MTETSADPQVVLRYWAAARQAAGVESEQLRALTLAGALDVARSGHDAQFARVLAICSFLVDEHPVGTRPPDEVVLIDGAVIDVLPPFAGG